MIIKNIIKEEIRHFINEASIRSLDYYDIVIPEYIREIEMSDNYERFIEIYKMEENIDDDVDIDEIEKSDDFKDWFKYELKVKYDEVIDNLYSQIKPDNTIDIWREMTVDDKWINDLLKTGKHLGIYWSWNERAAEAHGGHFGGGTKKVMIKSSVNEKYVDWIQTIRLNMDISLGEDEKEIRLFKNTPLKIEELIYDGNDITNDDIKSKTFYA